MLDNCHYLQNDRYMLSIMCQNGYSSGRGLLGLPNPTDDVYHQNLVNCGASPDAHHAIAAHLDLFGKNSVPYISKFVRIKITLSVLHKILLRGAAEQMTALFCWTNMHL